jgi:two-component system LytT family sensor kinase
LKVCHDRRWDAFVMSASLFDLASLVVYTFGALTFCVFSVLYWGQFRRRPASRNRTVFPLFTLVCGIAFLNNLLYQAGILHGAGPVLVRNLAAGLAPPLMLHLVFEIESRGLRSLRPWQWVLAGFYAASMVSALARGLNETGWLSSPAGDALYNAPSALLAVAAALGIWLQVASRQPTRPGARAHRGRISAVLSLILVCAAADFAGLGGYVGQLPDYLLLTFFGLSLYYRERLIFVDLLVKRGIFLVVGAAILAPCLAAGELFLWHPSAERLYALTMLVLAFWLLGPWVYARLARTVDRVWLGRRYSAEEAERHFIREIQIPSSEDELRACSARSLGAIFQTTAEVCFGPPVVPAAIAGDSERDSEDDSLSAELGHSTVPLGRVTLAGRPTGVPFLSDDRGLLQSLAVALTLALDNVHFRADRQLQQQREQQLRWLASHAELKALRAQINPHFLFNTLSVIAGLIHGQPELADETIERLAQVFRYTLHKSENEWASLTEEVDFVAAYLGIEQARFGERLHVELQVDPDAARIPIPAMSVQPLVENAINHGLSAMEGPGMVRLRAGLDGEFLTVEVYDNGPGFPPDFSLKEYGDSHGLRNVAQRLRGYYGDSARLSWESGENGTRVALTIPRTGAAARQAEEASDPRSDRR